MNVTGLLPKSQMDLKRFLVDLYLVQCYTGIWRKMFNQRRRYES